MTRTLYKRGAKPTEVRVWYMTQDGNSYTTTHGVKDGKLTTSAPTVCVGKQGRSDEEQAAFEVESGYTYQLARTYFETEAEIDTPRFFQPMLAQKWEDVKWEGALKEIKKSRVSARSLQGTGIYSEPKLDGFCCIAQASGLTSREGQPIVAVPHVMRALSQFFYCFPDAVLHGELYNHDFKDDFEALSSILKKQNPTPEQLETAKVMQLHVYDYPTPDVLSRSLPYSERRELLELDLGEFTGDTIRLNPYTLVESEDHRQALEDVLLEANYEGQQIKLDIPYRVGKRSKGNLKNKVFGDAEFKLKRVEAGVGNYAGYAKAAIFELEDGREFGAGIKGGKSQFNADLLADCSDQHSATVRFKGKTKAGIPRHATVKEWLGTEGRVL
jgi:ATP-dependent DNA ligase